jgi:hypothetical protein
MTYTLVRLFPAKTGSNHPPGAGPIDKPAQSMKISTPPGNILA